MDTLTLPPDLQQFAAQEVAAGRYRDLDEVVRAGVGLLRQRSQAKAELLDSVLAAQAEGDRAGYLTGNEVAAHLRATIAQRTGTDVTLRLDPQTAAALADPATRDHVTQLIQSTVRKAGIDRLFAAMDALSDEARKRGLTDEILDAELAAYNAERRERQPAE